LKEFNEKLARKDKEIFYLKNSKEEVIELTDKLMKSQEDLIIAMDSTIMAKDSTIDAKDATIETKDTIISAKDKLIKQRDSAMRRLEMELMGTKGLLNSRGMLDKILKEAFAETMDAYKPMEFYTASKIIDKIENHSTDVPANAVSFKKIRELKTKCNVKDLKELYDKLSTGVHGDPWYGYGVRVFVDQMSESESCMILSIADFFHFDVTKA